MNNMFNWNPSPGQSIASPFLWVFFVVTIPLTVGVYIAWIFWFKHVKRQFDKEHEDSDLAEVERDLIKRMKTVNSTGSWGLSEKLKTSVANTDTR